MNNNLSINEKVELIKSVADGGEIIGEEELIPLFERCEKEKRKPIAYDGFEPSGRIHIPQGLVRAINVNKMTKAGFKFIILVADWHAACNHKYGGDLEKIKIVGEYFIEVWKSCGMDLSNVEFKWVSEEVKDPKYWEIVLNVSINTTLNRILRTVDIMGRSEKDILTASQILYPAMQAADIFYLKADVCQLGLDQRKVNMLAREIGEEIGFWKPIVVSHCMMSGLLPPQVDTKDLSPIERSIAKKMSKSKPDTAIFMTDSPKEVERKIMQAYCPEGVVEENPILEYCKYIIFEKFDSIEIKRPEKWGGNLEIGSYEELKKIFLEKMLHPEDLKIAIIPLLNKLLENTRKHFEEDKKASELLKKVESFQVTR